MFSVFTLRDNLEFIKNSVAEPTVIEQDELISVDIDDDFGLTISATHLELYVKPKVFKSCMLNTIGVSGLLYKRILDLDSCVDPLKELIKDVVKENIRNFVFFVDHLALPMEAVMVKPAFDGKTFMPDPVPKDALPYTVCTAHLPIDEGEDFNVNDFDHDMNDKSFTLSLSKIEESTNPFYAIVHNTAKIAWMSDKDKWEQKASIYDKERNMLYTLPRNYGKSDTKLTSDIIGHVNTLIAKLRMDDNYEKEYDEMLLAKLPSNAIVYLMENTYSDYKLKTILDTIQAQRESIKPALMKNIYKCLGYMIAQKIHCCAECRHLDEETL